MAFNTTTDRAMKISINLGALINSQVDSMNAVRKRERAVAEAAFQQIVIDQGLTYDAQIEYRKQQIEDENTKTSPDADYITQLRGSITDLRKLNRFKKIREDYMTNYEALKQGKISLQTHEQFLTDQLNNAQTEDERAEIRQELDTVRTQIGESEINTLSNRVLVAQKDGTVDVLTKTIDDVAKRKAFAELAGNTEESSAWDVSLTSLKKQLNETKVSNDLHDFDFQISRTGMNAVDKINQLDAKISSADAGSPITVGGVNYNSAQQYWTSIRDNYISGVGSGSFGSFFQDFEGEIKDKIDTVSAVNKFGFVPVNTIEAIQKDYDFLGSKAEFAPQAMKLTASKTSALAYGVNKSANALVQSSVESLQLQSGLKTLETLEGKFGIDLASTKASLNQKIIEKGSQLKGIKEAASELKKVGAETPSPEVAKGTTPGEIFNQNIKPSNPVTPPVKTETTPAAEVTPPAQPTAQKFKEIVIQAGDTLSGIAKRELGNAARYTELATFNQIADPNKIRAGAKLKIPTI